MTGPTEQLPGGCSVLGSECPRRMAILRETAAKGDYTWPSPATRARRLFGTRRAKNAPLLGQRQQAVLRELDEGTGEDSQRQGRQSAKGDGAHQGRRLKRSGRR